MDKFRLTIKLLLSLSILALSGCATTTSGGAVGADRTQMMLVSAEQLDQVAAVSYSKLLTEASTNGTLNQDHTMLERVSWIASLLEKQTKVFRSDAPAWNWEVNVISSKDLNAFCMPGGKIMVYSGLIEQLELTNDEIAIVLGHEIAHALREHSREQMSQALIAQGLIGAGATMFDLGDGTANIAAVGYQALVATQFSRTDESEADRIGLELAARAGYNPGAGLTFWKKMIAANSGGQTPEFLSTHPADANRVAQIQALLPTVMPLYNSVSDATSADHLFDKNRHEVFLMQQIFSFF